MICKARTQPLSQLGHLDQICFSNLVHGKLVGRNATPVIWLVVLTSGCACYMVKGRFWSHRPNFNPSFTNHFLHSRPSVYKVIVKGHSPQVARGWTVLIPGRRVFDVSWLLCSWNALCIVRRHPLSFYHRQPRFSMLSKANGEGGLAE